MAHTIRDKTKLLHRVRRIRGQINAVEEALLADHESSIILLTAAACRGAMDSLIAKIIGEHLQFRIVDAKHKSTAAKRKAVREIICVIKRYLK